MLQSYYTSIFVSEMFHTSFNCFFFQIDGITISSLDDVPSGPVSTFFRSIRNTLDFDFEDENEGWFFK